MKVLIVDDNKDFCTTIAEIVQSSGYETQLLFLPEDAISYLDRNNRNICLIMLDIEFGIETDKTGLDVLEFARRNFPSIPVVMISGKGSIESAVKATKLGAVNFIEKSLVSVEKIKEVLESAVARLGTQGEAAEIRKFLEMNGMVGKSKAMLEIGDSIIRFGRTDLNVLITGETGTGKKLVAKAIHNISRRAKYPFITVDIPNIPRELFQSELFGHNKGSFSGATENKKGLFHQGNKGTLFLDEIGDLPLTQQANLLNPIEEKNVRSVGALQSEDLDIRFISATDKDLLFAIRESNFREQLYHRLRECEIFIPPLSQRADDIPDIIEYYLKKHNEEFSDSKYFAPSSIEYMQEYSWPGNVRKLSNTIRVVLQTVNKDEIEVTDLYKSLNAANHGKELPQKDDISLSTGRTLKQDLEKVDKEKIEATLERCNGNVSKSAVQLGISRETLHNKIRKYQINVQMYRAKSKTKKV